MAADRTVIRAILAGQFGIDLDSYKGWLGGSKSYVDSKFDNYRSTFTKQIFAEIARKNNVIFSKLLFAPKSYDGR